MKRWPAIILMIFCFAVGGHAQAQSVPAYRGQVVQDEAGALTVAETAELTATLSALSPVEYRVLIVPNAGGADMTDYLDQVWDAWKLPGNAILVVIFSEGNNIRLHMGNQLGSSGLTPDHLIQAARESFGPPAREGKLVEAIATLATDLNKQVAAGGGVPARKVEPTTPQQQQQQPAPSQVQKGGTAGSEPATKSRAPSDTGRFWRTMSIVTFAAAGVLSVFLLFGQRRRRRTRRA